MNAASDPSQPYRGLRVLDVSQGYAGPYCAALLAQFGADVIKIEPPEGDWVRRLGKQRGAWSALALAANRGKRSVTVDLKRSGAATMLIRLAGACDVFIESFRPGVATKLGIDYAAVARANPRVVYLSVSAYGQTGPQAEHPGTDTVLQAYSGLMSLNLDAAGLPRRVGFLAVDTATALYAAQAVAAAVYGVRVGGAGQHLDVSLMQATAAFLAPKLIEAQWEMGAPQALNVPAGSYQTADGWIAISLSKEDHFTAICRAIDAPELITDPRFADFSLRAQHAGELVPQIERRLLGASTSHWMRRFVAAGILASRIHTPAEWLDDEQVRVTGAAPRIDHPLLGTIAVPRVPGAGAPPQQLPEPGAAAAEVLRDFGFAPDEVTTLVEQGIVCLPTIT